MYVKSKTFRSEILPDGDSRALQTLRGEMSGLIQVGLVFGLILLAVWTPQGQFNSAVSLLATACTLWFTARGPYSAREMGLSQLTNGVAVMLGAGVLLVLAVAMAGSVLRTLGPPHPVVLERSWQYCIWAMLQEFMLQSFFYLRLESRFGSRRAVLVAAALFSLAHIPSPVLTIGGFVGAILFCDLFRRYRNLLPLGLIHAALGLTIAATLPDSLQHHMRVGLGYLAYP